MTVRTVVLDGVAHRVRVSPDGTIRALEPTGEPPEAASERWTGGFVDLHAHGAAGHGYDDAELEGIGDALRLHRAHGTASALLSLVSAPLDRLEQRLRLLRSALASLPGALGVHLEGPFLAPSRRGAHDPRALVPPTPGAVDALLDAADGALRVVTLAPELPGALDAVDRFVRAGVVVAIGHTEADADTAGAALDRGASLVTHAFNAMPGLGHRAPGPIGAALGRSHVVLEAIADGAHVHPVVLAALFAAAPGRVALVTDAMAATGLGDGRHRLGGLDVDVHGGLPMLAGSTTLAGSTLTLDRAVRVAVSAGVGIDDAVAAASSVPARVLQIAPPRVAVGARVADTVALAADGIAIDPLT